MIFKNNEMINNNITDQEIISKIITFLDSKKAENIINYDLSTTSFAIPLVIIATARSLIHLKSLASETRKFVTSFGIKPKFYTTKDFESGWILLDLGFIGVHIFTTEVREEYNLEDLYSKAL